MSVGKQINELYVNALGRRRLCAGEAAEAIARVTADAWCASTLTPILKAKRAVESTSEIDVKDFSNVAVLLPEPMVVVDLQSGSLLGVNAAAKRILDLQCGSSG